MLPNGRRHRDTPCVSSLLLGVLGVLGIFCMVEEADGPCIDLLGCSLANAQLAERLAEWSALFCHVLPPSVPDLDHAEVTSGAAVSSVHASALQDGPALLSVY